MGWGRRPGALNRERERGGIDGDDGWTSGGVSVRGSSCISISPIATAAARWGLCFISPGPRG